MHPPCVIWPLVSMVSRGMWYSGVGPMPFGGAMRFLGHHVVGMGLLMHGLAHACPITKLHDIWPRKSQGQPVTLTAPP